MTNSNVCQTCGLPKDKHDNPKNKVICQIKKLLALAGSPNEHEAQVAMQQAQALMLKYNLTSGALNEYEHSIIKVVPDIMACYPQGFVISIAFDKWEPFVLGCVATLFGCHITVMVNQP